MSMKYRKSSMFGLGTAALGLVLAAGVLTLPAEAGVAGENCAAGWSKQIDAPGYLMCRQGVGIDVQGTEYVHIVDLNVARVVIRTEPKAGVGTKDALFQRRTVDEWWNYALNYTTSPTGGQLQAVINASFLTRYENTTPLSFPQKVDGRVNTSGANPDNSGKRVLGLYASGTKARIADYGYVGNDFKTTETYLSNVNSALVGYSPDGGPTTDVSRKTYVGGRDTNGDGELDRLYILATTSEISKAAAIAILRDQYRTSANIQLDGGGSTQMKTRSGDSFGSKECAIPLRGCRGVPDVLAIYAGK
jgi:hypothetical protein